MNSETWKKAMRISDANTNSCSISGTAYLRFLVERYRRFDVVLLNVVW